MTAIDATEDMRREILLDRIRGLSPEQTRNALIWLSGYRPDAVERVLEQPKWVLG